MPKVLPKHVIDQEPGECRRCKGTGKFTNGLECVPCKGTGEMTEADIIENNIYWRKQTLKVAKEERSLLRNGDAPKGMSVEKVRSQMDLVIKARQACTNAVKVFEKFLAEVE